MCKGPVVGGTPTSETDSHIFFPEAGGHRSVHRLPALARGHLQKGMGTPKSSLSILCPQSLPPPSGALTATCSGLKHCEKWA